MLNRIQKFREYLDYIETHYNNVQKAWQLLKDECNPTKFRFMDDNFVMETIDENIKNHDLSKLSQHEFTQYRQYFYPTPDEVKNKQEFYSGWDNHKKENPHHWQNWTQAEDVTDFYLYVHFIENIVDWVAMGFQFGDTARNYYENNKAKIELPQWAITEMYRIFDYIYPTQKTLK